MIDTDKYEGHTEGPWWFVEDWAEHPTKPVFVIRAHENEELVVHRSEWTPIRMGKLATDDNKNMSYADDDEWVMIPENDKAVDWMLMADAPDLLAEVKRLQRYEQDHEELWDIILNFSPQDSEEDDDIHEQWLQSVSQGYMGSVYEYIMMKQEEMIE